MVDLAPRVAYNHPPLLTHRSGKGWGRGTKEREEGRDGGWRFCHQHEFRVTVTFKESACDYRDESRKLLGVISYLTVLPHKLCFGMDCKHASQTAWQRVLR